MPLYIHQIFYKSDKSDDVLDGCGPEARYLLEAMILRELRGDDGSLDGAKVAANMFRLAEATVRTALTELVDKRLVVRYKGKSGRRGRPAVSYRISHEVLANVQGRELAYGDHARILERLFSSEDIMFAKPKPQGEGAEGVIKACESVLTTCNRFLLATLLVHADRLGGVTISKAKLRELTGFSDARLRYRLNALTRMGWVITRVPGITSAIFPKQKVSTTYFLDLIGLGGEVSEDEYVLVRLTEDPAGSRFPLNEQISGLANGRGKLSRGVSNFLSEQRDAVFDVLRFRLRRYASYVLSRHGINPEIAPTIEDTELREQIAADFQRPERWKEGKVVLDPEWGEVISHFYKLSFMVAKEFARKPSLEAWKGGAIKQMYIVPSDKRFQHFLVLRPVDAKTTDSEPSVKVRGKVG